MVFADEEHSTLDGWHSLGRSNHSKNLTEASMFGIQLNTTVIKTGVRIVKNLITAQSRARTRLLSELTAVCEKCEDAYSSLLTRLKPIRSTFRNPNKLAIELRSLASDANARRKFKPEHLCSEIDKLLMDLSSNVNALKYSVNVFSINDIRRALKSMGNYDQALYHQYDTFMAEMNSIASAIESGKPAQKAPLAAHAAASIDELQKNLQSALKEIRKAKNEIVSLA
jgi:hypothetical protein